MTVGTWQPESELGRVLDCKYRLTRVLGAGSCGGVFEGRALADRGRVAVKLLRPHLMESQEIVARFLREAQIAATLDHPGVVKFLASGRHEDGRPYLVSEFLYGEDMESALEAQSLTFAQVFEIFLQLLDALEAVHAQGLVHRDVKPANVFLLHDQFGDIVVKLVDFGIVKPPETHESAELTRTGKTLGTPYYMSPEQVEGAELDARADAWSVGVVMYEALTGRVPWDGKTPTEVMVGILTAPPPSLEEARPDLPAWVSRVVSRALTKNREQRFQSAAEMARALRSFVAG